MRPNSSWRGIFLSSTLVCLGIQSLWIYKIADKFGWDFRMYRAAYLSFVNGLDPYLLQNLETFDAHLTFPNFPIFLPFLAPLGWMNGWTFLISQLFVFALLISIAAVFVRDLWGASFLILTGFWAVGWNLASGNLALIEAVCLATAFLFIKKDKLHGASGILGASASFKLFPIFYVGSLPLIFKNRGWLCGGTAFLVFLIPPIISFLFLPDLFNSWLEYNLGNRKTQLSPIDELTLTHNSPSAFNLFYTLGSEIFGMATLASKATAISLYVAMAGVLYGMFIFFRRRVLMNEQRNIILFAFAVLLISFLIPRFKPYSFCHLLVPLAILADRLSFRSKWLLGLTIFIVSPLSLFFNEPIRLQFGIGFWWYAINFSQTFALIIAVVWILRFYSIQNIRPSTTLS